MNELEKIMWDSVENDGASDVKSRIIDFHKKDFPSIPIIAVISAKGILWISTKKYFNVGLDGILGISTKNFMRNVSYSEKRLEQLRRDIDLIESHVRENGEPDPCLRWMKTVFQNDLSKISLRVVPAIFKVNGRYESISEEALDFVVDHLYFTDCIPLSEGNLEIGMDQVEKLRAGSLVVRPKDALANYIILEREAAEVMPEKLLSLFQGRYGHVKVDTGSLDEEISDQLLPITAISDGFPMTTSLALYTKSGVLVVPDELRLAIFSIFGYGQTADGRFSLIQKVDYRSMLSESYKDFKVSIKEFQDSMNEVATQEQEMELNSWITGILEKVYKHIHGHSHFFVVPLRDIDVFHIPSFDFNAPLLKVIFDSDETVAEWKKEVSNKRFSWAIVSDREIIDGIMTNGVDGCSNTLMCLGFNGSTEDYKQFVNEVSANDIN